MVIAINLSTLGDIPLDDQLAAAAGAGFEMVELRAPQLVGVTDLAARLAAHGLRACSINSLEGVGERDLLDEAGRLSELAASCGCPYVVAVPGRRQDSLAVELARLGAACSTEGAQLAFEFMGFEWSAVRSLAQAAAVYDGPLVVDTFHWCLGDGALDALRSLDPGRLALVHVNDAPSTDLTRLGDADRLLPGEGVLDLAPFYAALRDIGYDGVYSVELFSPVSAARARQAMSRLT
jgi:2-keto-myo-inositol isomerase